MRPVSLLSSCAAVLCLGSCAEVAGHGKYELHVTFVDAETSALVSRNPLWFEASNVATGETVSPGYYLHQSSFTVRMPLPDVRLRVQDWTSEYRKHEETFVVPPTGIDCVIRLVPTHFVLLKGRLLVEDHGQWVKLPREPHTGAIGENLLLSFCTEERNYGDANIDNGIFEIRLPRDRFEILILDSPFAAEEPRVLDLTGVKDDVIERDFHLVR